MTRTISPITEMTENLVPSEIDGKPIEYAVAKLLREKKLVASVAESLTGGMVAARLIDVAGISANFREGIVAYANEAKTARLGVMRETLTRFGAVSSQTAEEMVEGLLKEDVDIAVSTTGIAGPTGGTKEKPVGLVWFGFGTRQKILTDKQIFSGNRAEIREKATNYALYQLFLLLQDF